MVVKSRASNMNDNERDRENKRPRYTEDPESEHDEEGSSDAEEEEESEEETTLLKHHFSTAKPSLLQTFTQTNGRPIGEEEALKNWNSLAGTLWQDDIDICRKAFTCGVPADVLKGKKILKDSKFVVSLFQGARKVSHAKDLWKTIDEGMTREKEVGFAAYSRGVPLSWISLSFRHEEFIKEGLCKGKLPWDRLSLRFQEDIECALCAKEGGVLTFATALNTVSPWKLWTTWARQDPWSVDVFWSFAPTSIRNDPELMLEILAQREDVARALGSSLASNIDFVKRILDRNILVLAELQEETFHRFPSLMTIDKIQRYMSSEKGFVWKVLRRIPGFCWNSREFVLQWLKMGCDLPDELPRKYLGDRKIIMTHARNYRFDWQSRTYKFPKGLLTESLVSNKAFVHDLLRLVPAVILRDMCIQMPADEFILHALATNFADPHRLLEGIDGFSLRCAKWLAEYERFFRGALCGISLDSGSPLFSLNQGTDANIKKTIASFLDFPKGQTLKWLFQAAINLDLEGFNPECASAADRAMIRSKKKEEIRKRQQGHVFKKWVRNQDY